MLAITLIALGCRSNDKARVTHAPPVKQAAETPQAPTEDQLVWPAAHSSEIGPNACEPTVNAGELPFPVAEAEEVTAVATPQPDEIVASVRDHFPMIREAIANRVIASGEALSAQGAFDRKLEGYSNAQPLDFYENNWHKWGVKRDTMWGGQVGAGYRIGRGSFEPWYKERETNDLGEFGVSLTAPIIRDIDIDANRAELWRAQLERNRVEPIIRAQVLLAIRNGMAAYWEWVAAGANREIAQNVLQLGLDRVDILERQIELGEKADIDLVDNQRIIVSRRAKLIDARRKQQQAAVKLSLFFRDELGQPLVIPIDGPAPDFPETHLPDEETLADDVDFAVANRPELEELMVAQQQLNVAYRQAQNEFLPDVDAGLFLGQDVGNPTSDDDKSEFEIEATLTVSVPLERRKARGKIRQVRGKAAQLRAKTQFASDKVGAEVRVARAALIAAAERVIQTEEGVRLAERMQLAEKRLFDEGQSTLFNLNIREQQTAEAAGNLVAAQLEYFVASADYSAALGLETWTPDAGFLINGAPSRHDGSQGDCEEL